jgi:hypothetical protein
VSNFLAIASVTATLRTTLQSVIDFEANKPNSAAPAGTVTTIRPDAPAGQLPDPGVNLFLFRVTENVAFRNVDLPSRDGNGGVVQRPRAALDLHYLLTFYGDDGDWQPQRLMGIVVRALHGRPVLTREDIRATVTQPALLPALRGSNLADEVEDVKFTPSAVSLEELSKIWSVFPETSYALSSVYEASVVFIEGDEPSRVPLPVRERNVYAIPFRHPVVETVVGQGDPTGPILATSTLSIGGRGLAGDVTLVRLGAAEVAPTSARDRELILPLPALPPQDLLAGVQGLQVVHRLMIGTPEAPHEGVESNVAPVVIQPSFALAGGSPIITPALAPNPDGTLSGTIDVTLVPEVGKRQRASLLLNEATPPLGQVPRVYVFEDPSRDLPAEPDRTPTLSIPVDRVAPGTYLVRVRIDGADTPLEVDATGAYIGPTRVLP